jgi:hypothetical protein
MTSLTRAALTVALGLALASPVPLSAQAVTSAFTYQGELRAGGNPANANFDMEFRLFNAATGGTQIGPVVTRLNVPAVNGLFNVQLDFGASQFAGDRQWLEVRIKPAGSGSYETLSPRTEVTATPYALGAVAALPNAVTTTSIVDGTIGTADIDATQIQRRVTGSCPTGQYVRVVAQDGTVTCGTDATGSGTVTSIATGAGLTGGPITTSGTISVAPGGIGAAQINDTQVQRRVTGTCTGTNYVQQVNADGTVGCGPAPTASGWSLTGNGGTNPATNFIGTTDAQAFVVRTQNVQSLRIEPSTILFGGNPITANVIAGSSANNVTPGVRGATIAGGGVPSGDSEPAFPNEAPNQVTDVYGSIGGGYANRAGDNAGTQLDAPFATVAGGSRNIGGGGWAVIGGGGDNTVGPGGFGTIGGGLGNIVSGDAATVSGGELNIASGGWGGVGGGLQNTASGGQSTVSGGRENTASGNDSVIGGGFRNTASGALSVVAGGRENTASGIDSVVAGGQLNCAGGALSWAGGRRAKVRPGASPGSGSCAGLPSYPGGNGDFGSFVWADSQNADFVSSGSDQFLVRANGGVGVNTNQLDFGAALTISNRLGAGLLTSIDLKAGGNPNKFSILGNFNTSVPRFAILRVQSPVSLPLLVLDENNDLTVASQAFKPGGGPWAVPSDTRLKSHVESLGGTLDRLLKLRGVRFEYRPEVTPKAMYLPGQQIGFIAQEVEQVFPDWVAESADGYKTVGPRGFEALTVEALRELRAESAAIDGGQSARIAALEAENATLRSSQQRLAVDNAALRAESAELRARLERLEALVAGRASEER